MATMQQPRYPGVPTLRRFYGAVAAAALAGAAILAFPHAGSPAAAQAGCAQPPVPADPIPELPWPQQWFAPERVWPLSQGGGVVVAVVDTGVDAGHPQLRGGGVLAGTDLLPEPAGAHVDCDSHGTAVASIIAARPAEDIGFAGLAPRAEILPVRVVERGADTADPDQPPVAPGTFAAGIQWATDRGAQVINLSIVFYRDHPAIAGAIADAVRQGVVVVAAVGPPLPEEAAGLAPYPAAYPDVIGVGSVGIGDGGAPVLSSYLGPEVDLVAPGDAVTAAAAVSGHQRLQGSSFAAPFVSAAAALLLAAEPDLPASELSRRLVATADPGPGAPGGSSPPIVNPYRALTERLVDGQPVAAAEPLGEVAVDPAAQARSGRWQRAGQLAVVMTAGAVALFALLAGGGAIWRRGTRRGWRPIPAARRREPDPSPAGASGVDDPERLFFTVPRRRR